MRRKYIRIFLLLVVISLFNGCSPRRVNVHNVNRSSNNLRMTLLKAPKENVIGTQWNIKSQNLTNRIDAESYNAAKAVFGKIGFLSERTTFSPHLIASINEVSCNISAFGAPCVVSIDLYWGTGEFVGTYEDNKQSSPWSASSSAYYNCFVSIFQSIVKQIVSDQQLSNYFKNGFDDSLSSRTPNIPLLPYRQATIKEDAERRQSAKMALPEVTTNVSGNFQTEMPSLSETSANNIYQEKWAVVVGISQYQYSGKNGLNNLVFADDDAKTFGNSLRKLNWPWSHIKLLVNEEATRRNIMIALESWLSKAGPNDEIILFWAGHGYPDPEDPEKVYFATYDTDISIPATGYRMDQVRRALEERRSKNVILLADTCHAGKLITRGYGSRGISIVPNINKMVRERKVPKGWIFMVGADTDRQAIEHTSWTNGAFTHSLLKGLNGEADGFQSAGAKDGIVTMGELKDYMKTAMPDETQKVLGVAKHPVITTSTGDPNIWNLTLQVTQ